ncbi:hypothetical protein Tco_0751659 [Tanacetum coccineum]|uniref:Uncharacterized protein n=1 Tax=Tanacetum coccineum TaxID=301880 RepID=A0ABQ4Z8A3_9ASTR
METTCFCSKDENLFTADDNIISDDPYVALEFAKSISKTEAEEQETARLVHETHERIVTTKSTGTRKQTRDTLAVSNKKTSVQAQKNKGGSSEGSGSKLQVPNEPKGKSRDTSVGVGLKPEDTNDEEEDEFVHTPDDYVPTDDITQDADDEVYDHINEEMYDDVNVELKDSKLADERNGDEETTNTEKVDAEHEEANQEVTNAQVQDEARVTTTAALDTQKDKIDVPPSSSSRSVSFNYVILKPIVIKPPEIVTTAPATTIPPLIPPFIPYSQQSIPILTPTTTEATTSTLEVLESETLSAIHFRVLNLEKEVKEIKNVDHSTTLLKTIKSEVLTTPADDDRDEDPLVGSDQGLKKRKTSKDVESSKGNDMGTTDEQLNVEAAPKKDWFKKPKRPPTLDPEWNVGKLVDNEPTQKWLSDVAKAGKPPTNFNKLMSTPIEFSAFVMNRLQITNLTKADLVGPVYNLLKGTCKSCVELENNMKEYYFFNNDQKYLRGGNTGRKYTTSITKTKAAKYDLRGIEDMVPTLWSPIKVAFDKHVALVNKWYGYGHLEEIEVRRADQKLYKFMEGDFPRLHLNDIEDMLLLIAQNKLFNLKESYQKKLNISKPRTRDEDLSRRAPYTTLSDPQGIIYEDKLNKKRLMRSEELYKFSNDKLQSVQDTLHDMENNLRMSDEVLKLKKFKKDDYISFQDQEKYEHVGPKVTSSQEGKRSQDDDKRLDLADDLIEAQVYIQVKLKEQAQA